MKTRLILATAITLFGVGLCFGPLLFAQKSEIAEVKAPKTTKIAVINMTEVIRKDQRIQEFQEALWDSHPTLKAKAEKLRVQLHAIRWQRDRNADQEKSYREKQRELAELSGELHKLAAKKCNEFQVNWWNEVNSCIGKVAECYGFHIVLGHGEPGHPLFPGFPKYTNFDDRWNQSYDAALDTKQPFSSISRKMVTLDEGGTSVLFADGSVDLTQVVIETLAHWRREAKMKKLPD